MRLRATALALLLATAAATPSLAGIIYGSAVEGGATHLFQIGQTGTSFSTEGDGLVVTTDGGPNDQFALTTMAGVGNHLVVSGPGDGLDIYAHVTPDTFGAGKSGIGAVDLTAAGNILDLPIRAMTPLGAEVYASTWDGAANDFFHLRDQSGGVGGYTDLHGLVTYGPSDFLFDAPIDTLASYGGQIYGTSFVGGLNLFYSLTPNSDGLGAHIGEFGVLMAGLSGQAYAHPLTAMVGGDTGLQGVAWIPGEEGGGINDYFNIALFLGGPGGSAFNNGALRSEGRNLIHYKVDSLAYLPDPALPPGDPPPTASVPEPATWALMLAGFGLAGAALRRRTALQAV